MMISPFIYGPPVPPKRFINREDEVRRIFSQLAGPAFGSVAIVGKWRIGKTSLLHYICHPETRQEWALYSDKLHFVYMDCQSISQFTPTRFWQEALWSLAEQLEEGTLRDETAWLAEQENIEGRQLRRLLNKLAMEGRRLALLVDEFDWTIRLEPNRLGETADFLGMLRSLVNYTPRVLALVIATRQRLSELTRDLDMVSGSPFYNIFVHVFLKNFTEEEANQLIDQALEEVGVGKDFFDKEDRNFIYKESKGHPYWLQSACYKLFEHKQAWIQEKRVGGEKL